MSDDEEHSEPEETKSSEAELALKKRREAQSRQISSKGLDDAAKELLATNKKDRDRMDDEIQELRRRNDQRKKERLELDKRLAAQRAEEDARRKVVEEEKRKKKEEEDKKRQAARAQRQAEFEKFKDVGKRNFVISSSGSKGGGADSEQEEGVQKKSKEQLDAEKKAILKQRIKPLEDLKGFDKGQLTDKAKELHKLIARLEGEKYDLEKRFKVQQIDMTELADRARQANKVGRGGLKRVQQGGEDIDIIQAKFAGTPAKVEMFSKYERQKDKRSYSERVTVHSGPQYLYAAEKVPASKIVKWGEDGLPFYEELGGAPAGEHGGH